MSTMNPDSKFKEIFLIVKSGIVGALALTGICIILFLLGFAVRGEFISSLYQKTFAKCSWQGLLIATSGLGFVLGMIARRRLTLKSEIILIAVFSVPLIIGAWLLNTYADHVELSREVKLADCTNSVVSIHLNVPMGHNYYLVLALPGASAYTYSGHIHISKGMTSIADFPISSGHQLGEASRFSLTGGFQDTNSPPLSQFVEAQKDYDIEIRLNPPPPPASSILLHWWQAYKDRNN